MVDTPLVEEFTPMAQEEICRTTPCRVIQSIPKIISMPSSDFAVMILLSSDDFAAQFYWYMSYDLIGSNFFTRYWYHIRVFCVIEIQRNFLPKFSTNETTGCTRIKQYNCRRVMDRKCTCHHRCSFKKLCKHGEINLPLFDLNGLLLALVLIVLTRILTFIGPSGLRTFSSKMIGTPTVKVTVCIPWMK